jgi:NAD(P)-dependent dehydrogenase (short-subunit alcohol dehydrogenase family)
MSSLKNKTVFITGGSRGIGKATALHFAKQGANVAICARSPEPLEKTRQELQSISENTLALQCDTTNKTDIQNTIAQIKERFGAINILINNAGTYVPGSILETSVEEWDRQFAINLNGPFLTTQAVVPQMAENGGGIIIFISSTIALESPPFNSLYTATKWGLDGFSGSISPELLDRQTRLGYRLDRPR